MDNPPAPLGIPPQGIPPTDEAYQQLIRLGRLGIWVPGQGEYSLAYGDTSAVIASGTREKYFTVTHNRNWKAYHGAFTVIYNANSFLAAERPISVHTYNYTVNGFDIVVDTHAGVSENKTVQIAWLQVGVSY